MRVSREKMVENRSRILEEAGRLFRDRGFEAVGVAEVMKAAGLTHGGFYGHFESKDDLIASTLAHLLQPRQDAPRDFDAFADAYLSDAHRDNPSRGCPMAALASETAHGDPAARAAMTAGLRSHVDRLAASVPCEDAAAARREAIGRWSAMVGALILSRACDDPALAGELLRETRAWIGRGTDGTAAGRATSGD